MGQEFRQVILDRDAGSDGTFLSANYDMATYLDYTDQLGDRMEQFGMVDTVMSAADLSAPAFAGAALGIEITQTIQLKGEEYSTVRLTVESGSFLDGALVGPLESNEKMEVVLVGSGDGSVTVDPGPEATIQAGDDIVIFAQHSRVLDAVTRNRKGRR